MRCYINSQYQQMQMYLYFHDLLNFPKRKYHQDQVMETSKVKKQSNFYDLLSKNGMVW